MTQPTTSPLAQQVYADAEQRTLTQRMRSFLRGRNAGELVGFDDTGKPISCRLIGETIHGHPISAPGPRESEAAFLFYGATAQDAVAEAVATKQLWAEAATDAASAG